MGKQKVIEHYSADPGAREWLEAFTDKQVRAHIVLRTRYKRMIESHTSATWTDHVAAWMIDLDNAIDRSTTVQAMFTLKTENALMRGSDSWRPRSGAFEEVVYAFYGTASWTICPMDEWIPEPL
jgi:hypothetical protein